MAAVARVLLLFATGLAWWTLLEYLLHRFGFHRFPRGFGSRHMGHHARLLDRRLAIAPLATVLPGASLHAIAFVALFGPVGWVGLVGVLTGYLTYEVVHFRCHYSPVRSRWMRALKKHHMLHHFRDTHARFGVTSPFWDMVFRTLPRRVIPRAVARAAGR